MNPETKPSDYRVYFINFGYYSANESTSLEGARKIAKNAGFQSVIECRGTQVATYCPLAGFGTSF